MKNRRAILFFLAWSGVFAILLALLPRGRRAALMEILNAIRSDFTRSDPAETDLLLLHAAPGASGFAALLDGDRVLAEASWRKGERARLDARLPEEPGCLRLRLTMIPPDGLAVRHPDLPVFVGRRAPLEAALNLRLSV